MFELDEFSQPMCKISPLNSILSLTAGVCMCVSLKGPVSLQPESCLFYRSSKLAMLCAALFVVIREERPADFVGLGNQLAS